jgi:aminopeptidase N
VSALEPFVERYHAVLGSLEDKGSMALVESIVSGFYPRGLASAQLRDATQAWLDEHTEAHDALRRLVAENRDPITRALAAQERDARA